MPLSDFISRRRSATSRSASPAHPRKLGRSTGPEICSREQKFSPRVEKFEQPDLARPGMHQKTLLRSPRPRSEADSPASGRRPCRRTVSSQPSSASPGRRSMNIPRRGRDEAHRQLSTGSTALRVSSSSPATSASAHRGGAYLNQQPGDHAVLLRPEGHADAGEIPSSPLLAHGPAIARTRLPGGRADYRLACAVSSAGREILRHSPMRIRQTTPLTRSAS